MYVKSIDKHAGICYNERMRKPDYLTETQTRKFLSISARTASRLIEAHGAEVLGEMVLPIEVAEAILSKRANRRHELEKRLAPIVRQQDRAAAFARSWE